GLRGRCSRNLGPYPNKKRPRNRAPVLGPRSGPAGAPCLAPEWFASFTSLDAGCLPSTGVEQDAWIDRLDRPPGLEGNRPRERQGVDRKGTRRQGERVDRVRERRPDAAATLGVPLDGPDVRVGEVGVRELRALRQRQRPQGVHLPAEVALVREVV